MKRASQHQNLVPIPWEVDNLMMADDFSTGYLIQLCKVSPEVWLSTLGQTSDPSLTSVVKVDANISSK